MKVVALTGHSGAGKTTLIVGLIRRFVAQGKRVGAIKHTHHALNEEHRGDTARFLDAGAEPVILAAAGAAVVFDRNGTARARYDDTRELLAHFETDVVLIEGFKDSHCWPSVRIDADDRPTVDDLMAELDIRWRSI
jgi:molybdopterin-guanine dinucleotide biosynthesis protein B